MSGALDATGMVIKQETALIGLIRMMTPMRTRREAEALEVSGIRIGTRMDSEGPDSEAGLLRKAMKDWLRMVWMTNMECMQLKPGWLMMRELHVLSEQVTFAQERAYLASNGSTRWCFDSGATNAN